MHVSALKLPEGVKVVTRGKGDPVVAPPCVPRAQAEAEGEAAAATGGRGRAGRGRRREEGSRPRTTRRRPAARTTRRNRPRRRPGHEGPPRASRRAFFLPRTTRAPWAHRSASSSASAIPAASTKRTRHNAGFWFVDALAARLGASLRRRGQVPRPRRARRAATCWLLKPGTYMNLSRPRGRRRVAQFFAIAPAEILVVHDELDLPPGEAKLKFGGGTAGHNGLRDIAAQPGQPGLLAAAPGHRPPARLGDPAAGRRRLRAAARRAAASARGDRRRDRPRAATSGR